MSGGMHLSERVARARGGKEMRAEGTWPPFLFLWGKTQESCVSLYYRDET